MKLFKKENRTKEIILLTVLVILFNFVVPNYAQAADFGGTLFNPFAQLIRGICDAIIDILEDCFVGYNGNSAFELKNNLFTFDATAIRYSPAIIFANKVPLFSINFITDESEQNVEYFTVNDWKLADQKRLYIEEVLDDGFIVKYKINETDYKYEFVAINEDYTERNYYYNGKTLPVASIKHGEAHIDNKILDEEKQENMSDWWNSGLIGKAGAIAFGILGGLGDIMNTITSARRWNVVYKYFYIK